jgi:short subunit dehydrogenase-like uncharacterized protein
MNREQVQGALVVYGAYGYTGELIVRRCLERGLRPLLSGRNAEALAKVAERHQLPHQPCGLSDASELDRLLAGAKVVIHAAGPFIHTARPMVEACLRNGVHYTDITGEIEVFRLVHSFHARAQERGIMLMSGTGFDVVPSDCLAAHLKERMADATHLELAFASGGRSSRGTSLTVVEGLGRGGAIRENGRLKAVPDAFDARPIPFEDRERMAVTIPWGDVYTAYLSTGIPNIRVYMAAAPKLVRGLRVGRWFGWLLRTDFMKERMRRKIRAGRPGPSDAQRAEGYVELWGMVRNGAGRTLSSTLRTPDGYTLTAEASVHVAERIIQGDLRPGYQTPSLMYGSALITRFTARGFRDHDHG